jgi:6-pyruvoyl-tetrahydropterin synthase related domain
VEESIPSQPGRGRRAPTARQINITLLVLLSVIIVAEMRLDLILTTTTPTGGDNGGHIWTADYVRREMLPHLRLIGWSNDWFGGVPVLGFYFPAPTWLIVALSFVLPYQIAYKIVTILGIATLPVLCHGLGKHYGLKPTRSLFLGLSAFPFLLSRHFRILGGNILSTMAGEFSFSISLSFAVLYAGLLVQLLRTGRRRSATAVVLALTGLSHIVPTLFALAFTVAATVVELRRKEAKRQLTDIAAIGAVAGLLAGFWLLPFARNLPYANSMDYERYTHFIKTLFPFFSDSSSLQTPKDGSAAACAALILGAVAVVVGFWRRDRLTMTLALTMAIIGVGFRVAPQGAMWNIRLLPLWFFCAYLLAGQTVAVVVGAIFDARRPDETRVTRNAAPAIAGTLLFVATAGAALQILPPFLPIPVVADTKHGLRLTLGRLGDTTEYKTGPKPFGWAASNAQGSEKKTGWPEYTALLTALKPLPCGRALWEPDKNYTRFGSSMALMQLPYWTNSCIQSSEGLYFEASLTAPFHWLTTALVAPKPSNPQRRLPYPTYDLTRGVTKMRQLGIRYFIAHSPKVNQDAATLPDLRIAAKTPTFTVYEIADNAVVTALQQTPVVVTGIGSGLNDGFTDVGIAQWMGSDNAYPVTLVTSGPSDWPRTLAEIKPPAVVPYTSGAKTVTPVPKRGLGVVLGPLRGGNPDRHLEPVTVSKVAVNPMSVRFHVDRTGVPVLVRISWFPNWQARSAKGPYRAMPNYMVVIPTGNDVVLDYGQTGTDRLGLAATLLGLTGAVGLRRKRRSTDPDPLAEVSTTVSPDPEVIEESGGESVYELVESPRS